MEFSYFGSKEEALSEDVELQDWSLKLVVKGDSLNMLKVSDGTTKKEMKCNIKKLRI